MHHSITHRVYYVVKSVVVAAAGITAMIVSISTELDFHQRMGAISVVIAFLGYTLYLFSLSKPVGPNGKCIKPPPLSWMMFGFLTGTGWLIQVAGGGGAGSWCLGVTAAFCFVIAAVSYLRYRQKFGWDDWAMVAGGFVLFGFYLITREAALSATLATLADVVCYYQIVKNGWINPEEDYPANYALNSFKCAPALLALSVFSYANSAYLWMLLIVNGLVAIMLITRRVYLRI